MPSDLAATLNLLHWPLAAVLGVGLDRFLGEPRRGHPLVAFGWLAQRLEARFNPASATADRSHGVLAWACIVLPWVALAFWLRAQTTLSLWVDSLLFYFALGARSLSEHALAVAQPLEQENLDEARQRVGWMVSRDTSQLDSSGIARATVESVLENGNDAIFATFFWFAVLGGPGALLFRLANTLDAMWGYRTPRLLQFGWAAARIDDLLNWLPARLTALSYALLGQTRSALQCWRLQAPTWDSPNAGPVMAAGAGSLGISLGGPAIYHGRIESRPPLGAGPQAEAPDIRRADRLVRRTLWLWFFLFTTFHLIALSPS